MALGKEGAILAVVALIIGLAIGAAAFGGGGEPQTVTQTVTQTQTVTSTVTQTVTAQGGQGGGASPAQTVTVTQTVTQTVQAAGAGEGGLQGEIPIGLAIAVSGGYAVDGPRRLNGAMLAIEEFNSYLEQVGAPFKFKPIHEDTGAKPEGAVNVLNRFAGLGIKVVIGPLSTSETKAVMPIVNENKIVVISPSSTGKAAALPDDFVFRMPPPDTAQGPALAQLIKNMGFEKLVIMARDDDYGRGLANLVQEHFQNMGGQVSVITYQPNLPDYANEVNQLSTEVSKFGADEKTAVLIIAFDTDGINILEHASRDPVLAQVQWFGPDSMKRNTFLPPDAPQEVADFLMSVNFIVTSPSIARNPVTVHFEQAYEQKYGEKPTPYAYYAYDAAWVAMLSIVAAGQYDGEAVKNILPEIAFRYIGATGHKALDENGDAAFAAYDLSKVVEENGQYSFKVVGVINSATGQVTWYE